MMAPFNPVNYPNTFTVQGREIQVSISFENYMPKKENLLPEKFYILIQHQFLPKRIVSQKISPFGGFPGGAVVENPPANAGDTGSSPGLGRSHMPRSN